MPPGSWKSQISNHIQGNFCMSVLYFLIKLPNWTFCSKINLNHQPLYTLMPPVTAVERKKTTMTQFFYSVS